jgi:hypothetical protein
LVCCRSDFFVGWRGHDSEFFLLYFGECDELKKYEAMSLLLFVNEMKGVACRSLCRMVNRRSFRFGSAILPPPSSF